MVPLWDFDETGGDPWFAIDPEWGQARAFETTGRFTLIADTVEPRTLCCSGRGTGVPP